MQRLMIYFRQKRDMIARGEEGQLCSPRASRLRHDGHFLDAATLRRALHAVMSLRVVDGVSR